MMRAAKQFLGSVTFHPFCCAVLIGVAACTGSIGAGSSTGDPVEGDGGRSGAAGRPSGGGSGGRSGGANGGTGGIDGPSACSGRVQPGPTYLRRLTNWELDNSIRDLLGYTGSASADFNLVTDPTVSVFDNNAEGIPISTTVLERLQAAAEGITTKLLATSDAAKKLAGCDPATSGCVSSFVDKFGRRAFRRPLAADEKTALMQLAASGENPTDQIAQVVQGVLLSPKFLFRPEVGQADATQPKRAKLGGYELATRLSFLLAGTTPSDALLDAAGKGSLETAAGVESTARALLADARAKDVAKRFYGQWLDLDVLRGVSFETKLFPSWQPKLADAMREETSRLIEDFLGPAQPGKGMLDALTASYSYVNADLAKLYGVPAPAKDWDRITFDAKGERGGLLTQGSFLTLTSKPDHASAIRRGKFVRDRIVCTPIAPPPANVPQPPPAKPGETERERFARHTTEAACAGCHRLLDPVGYAFERFDAIGAFRTTDNGSPIDASGKLYDNDGNLGATFDGARELALKLRDLPDTASCAVTLTAQYALGRRTDEADACTIETLTKSFSAANGSFTELLVAFVTSDAFRYREPLSAQKGDAP